LFESKKWISKLAESIRELDPNAAFQPPSDSAAPSPTDTRLSSASYADITARRAGAEPKKTTTTTATQQLHQPVHDKQDQIRFASAKPDQSSKKINVHEQNLTPSILHEQHHEPKTDEVKTAPDLALGQTNLPAPLQQKSECDAAARVAEGKIEEEELSRPMATAPSGCGPSYAEVLRGQKLLAALQQAGEEPQLQKIVREPVVVLAKPEPVVSEVKKEPAERKNTSEPAPKYVPTPLVYTEIEPVEVKINVSKEESMPETTRPQPKSEFPAASFSETYAQVLLKGVRQNLRPGDDPLRFTKSTENLRQDNSYSGLSVLQRKDVHRSSPMLGPRFAAASERAVERSISPLAVDRTKLPRSNSPFGRGRPRERSESPFTLVRGKGRLPKNYYEDQPKNWKSTEVLSADRSSSPFSTRHKGKLQKTGSEDKPQWKSTEGLSCTPVPAAHSKNKQQKAKHDEPREWKSAEILSSERSSSVPVPFPRTKKGKMPKTKNDDMPQISSNDDEIADTRKSAEPIPPIKKLRKRLQKNKSEDKPVPPVSKIPTCVVEAPAVTEKSVPETSERLGSEPDITTKTSQTKKSKQKAKLTKAKSEDNASVSRHVAEYSVAIVQNDHLEESLPSEGPIPAFLVPEESAVPEEYATSSLRIADNATPQLSPEVIDFTADLEQQIVSELGDTATFEEQNVPFLFTPTTYYRGETTSVFHMEYDFSRSELMPEEDLSFFSPTQSQTENLFERRSSSGMQFIGALEESVDEIILEASMALSSDPKLESERAEITSTEPLAPAMESSLSPLVLQCSYLSEISNGSELLNEIGSAESALPENASVKTENLFETAASSNAHQVFNVPKISNSQQEVEEVKIMVPSADSSDDKTAAISGEPFLAVARVESNSALETLTIFCPSTLETEKANTITQDIIVAKATDIQVQLLQPKETTKLVPNTVMQFEDNTVAKACDIIDLQEQPKQSAEQVSMKIVDSSIEKTPQKVEEKNEVFTSKVLPSFWLNYYLYRDAETQYHQSSHTNIQDCSESVVVKMDLKKTEQAPKAIDSRENKLECIDAEIKLDTMSAKLALPGVQEKENDLDIQINGKEILTENIQLTQKVTSVESKEGAAQAKYASAPSQATQSDTTLCAYETLPWENYYFARDAEAKFALSLTQHAVLPPAERKEKIIEPKKDETDRQKEPQTVSQIQAPQNNSEIDAQIELSQKLKDTTDSKDEEKETKERRHSEQMHSKLTSKPKTKETSIGSMRCVLTTEKTALFATKAIEDERLSQKINSIPLEISSVVGNENLSGQITETVKVTGTIIVESDTAAGLENSANQKKMNFWENYSACHDAEKKYYNSKTFSVLTAPKCEEGDLVKENTASLQSSIDQQTENATINIGTNVNNSVRNQTSEMQKTTEINTQVQPETKFDDQRTQSAGFPLQPDFWENYASCSDAEKLLAAQKYPTEGNQTQSIVLMHQETEKADMSITEPSDVEKCTTLADIESSKEEDKISAESTASFLKEPGTSAKKATKYKSKAQVTQVKQHISPENENRPKFTSLEDCQNIPTKSSLENTAGELIDLFSGDKNYDFIALEAAETAYYENQSQDPKMHTEKETQLKPETTRLFEFQSKLANPEENPSEKSKSTSKAQETRPQEQALKKKSFAGGAVETTRSEKRLTNSQVWFRGSLCRLLCFALRLLNN